MITLYTAATPNGFKASITLEELGVEYTTYAVDLEAREQYSNWFLNINPNARIPAIVDHSNGDLCVFESGALMMYLVEKYGHGSLLPMNGRERYEVIEWLMFQMGGVGPIMGQANHFIHYASMEVPYAQQRYSNESMRLIGVLERRLSGNRTFLVGENYSLADIANFSWVIGAAYIAIDLDEFPNVKSWVNRIYAREATRRGLDVPTPFKLARAMSDESVRQKMIAKTNAKMCGRSKL